MEEFYYRCLQILEEVLESQGFQAQGERSDGLGRSIRFQRNGVGVTWSIDHREQSLSLVMAEEGVAVARGDFYSVEALREDFLRKLEAILASLGMSVPEANRRLAENDLASFRQVGEKSGLQKGLVRGKPWR